MSATSGLSVGDAKSWWASTASQTKRLATWLGLGVVAILVMSLGTRIFARLVRGDEVGTFDTIAEFFNVDGERNLPATASGLLFIFTAIVCFLVAQKYSGRSKLAWLFFSIATLAMAADEMGEIHERLLKWVGEGVGLKSGGTLFFVWVVPGFVLALAMVAVAVWLTKPLERWQRTGPLIAAIIFFGGALGVESITGILFDDGGSSLAYVLLQNVEEGMEFTGTALMAVIAFESLQRVRSAVTELAPAH